MIVESSQVEDPAFPFLVINFFRNAADAKGYLDDNRGIEGRAETLVADSVTAGYSSLHGVGGPPELDAIKGCLGR